jgi:hypothetical protein
MRRTDPPGEKTWMLEVEYSDGSVRNEVVENVKPKQTRARGETGWRPSIYMPRWASRITLEVTGVRVERLQNISEVDCAAEGIPIALSGTTCAEFGMGQRFFRELWDSINAKRAPWKSNPWVWVIEFQWKPPCV